jgi:hypothetical protein
MHPELRLVTTDALNHCPPQEGRRSMMTLPECAADAGVCRRFLEMEIHRGRLRAIKMSNRICRVRRSDWERYLDTSATIPEK